jgi:hypothetical protein
MILELSGKEHKFSKEALECEYLRLKSLYTLSQMEIAFKLGKQENTSFERLKFQEIKDQLEKIETELNLITEPF